MFRDSIMTFKLIYVLYQKTFDSLQIDRHTNIFGLFERVHLSLHDVYTVSYIDTGEF